MKYILFVLLFGGIVGCGDSRMSSEKMKYELQKSISDAWRSKAIGRIDSAFYFMGRAQAFYEAALNEK